MLRSCNRAVRRQHAWRLSFRRDTAFHLLFSAPQRVFCRLRCGRNALCPSSRTYLQGVKKMSVAFPASRNGVPDLNPADICRGNEQHEAEDSHNASCAWSFCSGQDRALSSPPDEAFKLISPREVNIKYGSQPIDSDSDMEDGGQSCEISDNVAETALSAHYITMGLVATAGCFAIDAVACRGFAEISPDSGLCTPLVGMSLPFVATKALSAGPASCCKPRCGAHGIRLPCHAINTNPNP